MTSRPLQFFYYYFFFFLLLFCLFFLLHNWFFEDNSVLFNNVCSNSLSNELFEFYEVSECIKSCCIIASYKVNEFLQKLTPFLRKDTVLWYNKEDTTSLQLQSNAFQSNNSKVVHDNEKSFERLPLTRNKAISKRLDKSLKVLL